jgi:hypothetical protein
MVIVFVNVVLIGMIILGKLTLLSSGALLKRDSMPVLVVSEKKDHNRIPDSR